MVQAQRLGWTTALLLTAGTISRAETVTLPAVADTSLFEWFPNDNFGRQREVPSGGLGANTGGAASRALFKFDVPGAIPPGTVLDSARMTLTVDDQVPSGRQPSDFALSRVLVSWGEGDGFGELPGGRDALDDEATWVNRFHDTDPMVPNDAIPWSIPGGAFGVDFADTASAIAENVNGSPATPISYPFDFDAAGLADLGLMIDGTVPNHGWVLHSLRESVPKTARRWISRESLTPELAPRLEITWSIPAPVMTLIEYDAAGEALRVAVDGRAGLRYELQSCDDLISWSPGESQTPVTDGELVFLLPAVSPCTFVRVEATLGP